MVHVLADDEGYHVRPQTTESGLQSSCLESVIARTLHVCLPLTGRLSQQVLHHPSRSVRARNTPTRPTIYEPVRQTTLGPSIQVVACLCPALTSARSGPVNQRRSDGCYQRSGYCLSAGEADSLTALRTRRFVPPPGTY